MSDFKLRLLNSEFPLSKSTTKIYERNNKTIIRNDNTTSSLRVTRNLDERKNPAPIQISNSGQGELTVENNMSGIVLVLDNGDLKSGSETISFSETKENSKFSRSIRVVDESTRSLLFKIEVINKSKEAPSVNEFVPQVYEDDESSNTKDVSEVLRRSEDTKLVGTGQFRDVYRVESDNINIYGIRNGSIVKVANSDKGVLANRSEIQTWQAVKSTKNKIFFCPIESIGPNHKYIVTKEAKNVGQIDRDIVQVLETVVKKRLDVQKKEYDINHPLQKAGWDVKKSNVGYYNGKPVLIDYPYGGKFELNSSEIREEFLKILEESI